jgi:DNA-binding NtrC family response regulator
MDSLQNSVLPSTESCALNSSLPSDHFTFVGVSPAIRKLITQVEIVGPHLQIGTIIGEPGVGKQTLAQLLQARSALARSGFIRCDAREWLLTEDNPLSLSGFIYLDRVDLLAAPGQALLLRILKALENRTVRPFALVASTESQLHNMAGQFVPELIYRLSAVRFSIPPLRRRREDIPCLAMHLLQRISTRYGLARLTLDPAAMAVLLQHEWPGNARELASVLEAASLNCDNGTIRPQDLTIDPVPLTARPTPSVPRTLNLDAVIHNHLRYVLDLNHGNKLRSARQLGISRSTLYRFLDANSLPPL